MKTLLAASLVVLTLSGCASIFNGKTQEVVITSVPEGASLTVANLAGETIHTGTTPATLTLTRGAGYFKSETYRVAMTKEGFEPRELEITSTVSGWYFGNILLGGFIGMLAVDPVTGAMYTFPETVTADLVSLAAKQPQAGRVLTIVSTDALTADQMQQARKLPSLP